MGKGECVHSASETCQREGPPRPERLSKPPPTPTPTPAYMSSRPHPVVRPCVRAREASRRPLAAGFSWLRMTQ